MDITPDTHFYESMENNRLGWHDALAELVDNSFDADATRAVLEFTSGAFQVLDDGIGAPDIASMVRLGAHKRHQRRGLGVYGVGVKEAWAWIGKTIDIRTTHRGKTTALRINRQKDIRQIDGRWICPDPQTREAQSSETGTAIRFEDLYPKRATPTLDQLKKLGLTFMPALESGRQILIKRHGKKPVPVEQYKLPMLLDCVTDEFVIDGKRVSISIGITPDGQHIQYPGFLLCYGHRVIRNSTIGMGGYSASRVTGKIVLGHGWKLTKNKNDLSDYAEDLAEAIHSRIRWLCEKAEQLSEDIESRELLTEVEGLLNETLEKARKREKRGRGETTGTVPPKGTGRKRKKADNVQHGDGSVETETVSQPKRKHGVRLIWFEAEPNVIGQPDQLSNAVLLNKANAFMARVRRTGNKEALYAVAMGIFIHDTYTNKNGQRLAFELHDFVSGWGQLMNGIEFQAEAHEVAHAV